MKTHLPTKHRHGMARKLGRLMAAVSIAALGAGLGAGFAPAHADPQRSQGFQQDAVRQLEAGDANAALIQLRNALQQDANNLEARQLLGELYLRTGDPVSAEKELRRVFDSRRGDAVELLLAQSLMMQRRYTDVFDILSPQGATPELTRAKLVMTGQAYIGTGQIEDAETMFRTALEGAPDAADAKLGLARTEALRNDLESASTLVEEVLRDDPDNLEGLLLSSEIDLVRQRTDNALAALNRAGSIAPDDPRVLLPRARVRLQTGLVDEAEKDVARVLERSPRDVTARYLKASIQMIRGDANGARETFLPIEGALADYTPSLLLNALIKFSTGQYAQAEAALNRFSAAVPEHTGARRMLAATHLRTENPTSAVEVLKPLVAAHPEDLTARQMLAGAYLRLGEFDQATAIYRDLTTVSDRQAALRARSTLGLLQAAGDQSHDLSPEERQQAALVLDYIRNGEFRRAHEAVAAMRQGDPDNPMLASLEAAVFMAEGDLGAARSKLEAARQMDPEMAELIGNLNAVDVRMGNLEAVEKRLRDDAAANPRDEQPALRLAQFLARGQRADEAMTVLESAAAAQQDSIPVRRALAELYARRGDKAKLQAIAAQLRQIGAGQPEGLAAAAAVYRAADEPGKAADALRDYVGARPDDIEARVALAQNLMAAGRQAEAKPVLEEIKAKDPANPVATLGLIDLALAGNDADAALGLADSIGQADPVAAAQLRSNVLIRTNRPAEALKSLEEAMDRAPDRRLAMALFEVRRSQGQADQAIAGLEGWVRENPDDVSVRTVLADSYLAVQNLKQAETHYDVLVRSRPNDPMLLNNAAWLKHELDRPDALELARRAYATAPNSPEIADTLGWILVQAGETGEGLNLLRRAAAIAPNNQDIQYHLAYALNASGAKDEARTILEKLTQDGQAFQARDDAAELLASIRR
ncbi:XrtA/PEP-CTERM system TPR-repeat protein PrsT [Skermanella pratensis]|uniref:XrtA/PEP-CTERM system TPR-repeat protein PrsT n=1 Tax=Skermanella pratensis TaxID=2233999 RepID=UPI0013012DE9|nr:XrtA/PEP-CTERM system TPR-repeat protein PrsT [Skermanella pratensis]